MNDKNFRYFLDLLMCCDPWPVEDDDGVSEKSLKALANEEAIKRGFDNWIHAFWESTPEEGE